MPDQNQEDLKPPQPPEIRRRLQFSRLQKVAFPLIFLVPILALAGVFGDSFDAVNAANSQLMVDIEYPTRFRYKMMNPIHASIHNTSGQHLPSVIVNFDRDYIDGFSNVTFTPEVKFITDEAYVLELTELPPGEIRVVLVEIEADKYGRHHGTITAVPGAGESVSVSFDTFVFP